MNAALSQKIAACVRLSL